MELNSLLENISGSLERYQIPYMVIGGQAVLLYGEPRLTGDIDITIGVGPEGLDAILKIGKEQNLEVLVSAPKDFVIKHYVLPMKDSSSSLRIDFIFAITDYEKNALNRANDILVDKKTVKYTSVEDLVIFKIIASREQDLKDIKNIVLKNPELDKSYIIKWLKILSEGSGQNYAGIFDTITTI